MADFANLPTIDFHGADGGVVLLEGSDSDTTTPPKFNGSPLKSDRNPIEKDRLPTIIFQGLF